MGIANKLIQWGWVDASGRSLTWHHWKSNPKPRQAVAYLRAEKGKKPVPLHNFLARDDFPFRARKAA